MAADDKEQQLDSEQLALIRQRIESAEKSLAAAKRLLDGVGEGVPASGAAIGELHKRAADLSVSAGGKIIEGIFDGQNMIGPDRRNYPVPANYASKSKLVEGDILKLTIADDGSFIYKQIGPVQRKRVNGQLILEDSGKYIVQVGGKKYRVLLASVTYFKAEEGDAVVLLTPEDGKSEWGAIENVIRGGMPQVEARDRADALSAFETSVDEDRLKEI